MARSGELVAARGGAALVRRGPPRARGAGDRARARRRAHGGDGPLLPLDRRLPGRARPRLARDPRAERGRVPAARPRARASRSRPARGSRACASATASLRSRPSSASTTWSASPRSIAAIERHYVRAHRRLERLARAVRAAALAAPSRRLLVARRLHPRPSRPQRRRARRVLRQARTTLGAARVHHRDAGPEEHRDHRERPDRGPPPRARVRRRPRRARATPRRGSRRGSSGDGTSATGRRPSARRASPSRARGAARRPPARAPWRRCPTAVGQPADGSERRLAARQRGPERDAAQEDHERREELDAEELHEPARQRQRARRASCSASPRGAGRASRWPSWR